MTYFKDRWEAQLKGHEHEVGDLLAETIARWAAVGERELVTLFEHAASTARDAELTAALTSDGAQIPVQPKYPQWILLLADVAETKKRARR